MSDNKPITQELRKYLKDADIMSDVGIVARARILDLCANIDAINEALEDEYAEMREFCNRLEDAADKREDVDLWGVSYTALPLDADGVPIHVGDEMQNVSAPASHGTVYRMELTCDGWWIYFRGVGMRPSNYRHHHEPTVEDVLREFADEMNQNLGMYTGEAIDADEWRDADAKTIAEYAKRLKLAEGEDA